MKNFYIKLLTIIVLVVSVIISVKSYYSYTQDKNFQIINKKQSLIIQLSNGEYLEIASKNDHISDGKDIEAKPFESLTSIQKISSFQNSISTINAYSENVQSNENSRIVKVNPIDQARILVEISANTKYTYTENLKYNIQVDYSNKITFNDNNKDVFFEDEGCKVTIPNTTIDHKISDNSQSVIFSQKYQLQETFRFYIDIYCK